MKRIILLVLSLALILTTINAFSLVEKGVISDLNSPSQIVGDDTNIFVGDIYNGIRAYEFDGTNFTLKGSLSDVNTRTITSMYYDGNYLYTNSDSSEKGIRAYQFDGANFVKKGSYTGTYIWKLAGGNGYIYATTGTHATPLIALTFNGTTFTKVGDTNFNNNCRYNGLGYKNGYIYVNYLEDSKVVFDFNGTNFRVDANYGAPWLSGCSAPSEPTVASNYDMVVDGNYLYTNYSSNGRLSAWLFTGTSISNTATYTDLNYMSGIWSDGTYIYTGGLYPVISPHTYGKLHAFDFNGTSFTLLSTFDTNTRTVWGDGTYLYAADSKYNLYAFEIDNELVDIVSPVSGVVNGVKTIDFNYFFVDGNKVSVELYYSSKARDYNFLIFRDNNILDGNNVVCDSYSINAWNLCHYDWNTLGTEGKYQSTTSQNIYISSDYGQVWDSKAETANWDSIAISYDGKYQVAAVYRYQLKVSNDYGQTWTTRDSNRYWTGVAISSDGKYISASVDGGNIYVSSNYGASFCSKASSNAWGDIVMSDSGKYQAIFDYDNGFIKISNDYGQTWGVKSSANYWNGLAMSGDGKYLLASTDKFSGSLIGYLYKSSDYGETWQVALGDSNREWAWKGLSISNSAIYQGAIVYGEKVYISSNYGVSWVSSGNNKDWTGIDISSKGKYISLIVDSSSEYIYVSDNFGSSFNSKGGLINRRNVSINDGTPLAVDGNYVIEAKLFDNNEVLLDSDSGAFFSVNNTIPVCSIFTYSEWEACNGAIQYRSVLTSSPIGCAGGTPVISQACTLGGGGGTQPPVDTNVSARFVVVKPDSNEFNVIYSVGKVVNKEFIIKNLTNFEISIDISHSIPTNAGISVSTEFNGKVDANSEKSFIVSFLFSKPIDLEYAVFNISSGSTIVNKRINFVQTSGLVNIDSRVVDVVNFDLGGGFLFGYILLLISFILSFAFFTKTNGLVQIIGLLGIGLLVILILICLGVLFG